MKVVYTDLHMLCDPGLVQIFPMFTGSRGQAVIGMLGDSLKLASGILHHARGSFRSLASLLEDQMTTTSDVPDAPTHGTMHTIVVLAPPGSNVKMLKLPLVMSAVPPAMMSHHFIKDLLLIPHY